MIRKRLRKLLRRGGSTRLVPTPSGAGLAYVGPLLEGQTALVTGAGRNVGRGIALELARHGASVAIVDSDASRGQSVSAELEDTGVRSWSFEMDLSAADNVVLLMQQLRTEGIAIDILVNNVGVGTGLAIMDVPDTSGFDDVYRTNVICPTLLSKLVAEHMISEGRGGSILFISSVHQWRIRKDPAYSSSKAAVGMLIKELSVELAPHGIRVNGVAPGWVEQDSTGNLRTNRRAPLHGTSIPPHYIGRAAVLLSSEYYSRYTTGAVLTVDAGFALV